MSMAGTYVCPYNVNTFYHLDGERSVASRKDSPASLREAGERPPGTCIGRRNNRWEGLFVPALGGRAQT